MGTPRCLCALLRLEITFTHTREYERAHGHGQVAMIQMEMRPAMGTTMRMNSKLKHCFSFASSTDGQTNGRGLIGPARRLPDRRGTLELSYGWPGSSTSSRLVFVPVFSNFFSSCTFIVYPATIHVFADSTLASSSPLTYVILETSIAHVCTPNLDMQTPT